MAARTRSATSVRWPRRYSGALSARAVEIGLANRVVEDLEGQAAALAQRLSDGPAFAYANTKVMLTREQDLDLAGALEMDALVQSLLMTASDFRDFYANWSAKR